MPSSSNKFKGRQSWKEKKERPSRKPVQKLELSPSKVQSPHGGAWGDAAPTWGDVGPTWGIDDDTPSGNKASSGSVWDDPKLEPEPKPAVNAETSEWGTEEWTYPGTNGEGNSAGDSWGHDNPAADNQNHRNSENTGGGDSGWGQWVGEADDQNATSGWDDSYNAHEYSEQDNQQHNNDGYGNSGSWGALTYGEVPASWGDEASELNNQHSTGNAGEALPTFSSSFQFNPSASVFVPKSFVPPTTAIQVEPEAGQSPLAVGESVKPSTRTTPSTAANSFPLHSALESGTLSTPATCLTDAGAEAADVTEQLCQVELEVAEYKLEVSEADLEMKKASLEVMRAKLEVMEKKRAMLLAVKRRAVK